MNKAALKRYVVYNYPTKQRNLKAKLAKRGSSVSRWYRQVADNFLRKD